MHAADRSKMPIDHSITYKSRGLRNLPHRLRLGALIKIMRRELRGRDADYIRYADFGCSNGYLTDYFSNMFHFKEAYGFDHSQENLSVAEEKHPDIHFEFFDLNKPSSSDRRFDLVTCFETLEHIGSLETALKNLLASTEPDGGILMISVPIEIGITGTFKFIVKKFLYRYSLGELGGRSVAEYLGALIRGERISRYRCKRESWGTHFGFDYRDVDEILRECGATFKAVNRFTTRYYVVRTGY